MFFNSNLDRMANSTKEGIHSMKPVTIYEIAKEAGVSTATVSRVINNKPNISIRTMKKVQAVLDKYNYHPSAIARGLVYHSLNLVGVIMRDIRHPHYNAFAYTVERQLSSSGYSCILSNASNCDPSAVFRVFSEIHVDGIIIIGSDFMNEATERAIADYHSATPIVFLNGYSSKPNVTSILLDDHMGIILCVEHMISRGRRKLVYVNDNTTDSAKRKLNGFLDAMNRHGFERCSERVISSTIGFEGGKVCGQAILKKFKGDVDGVICAEDVTALGCMQAFKKAGLRVPEDIAITGYSNNAEYKMSSKLLTSVDTKMELMGIEAVTALCDRIKGKSRAPMFTIVPELFIGETT